jgi:hypothetical protein
MPGLLYLNKQIRIKFPVINLKNILKLTVILGWLYWGLYALIAPVTVWDAQVYNLARIELANLGGLFGNHYWNMAPQVCFPWSFDAVHLPFLKLGFGYDLPSFSCLTGILMIVWDLVNSHYGESVAWKCTGAILALPLVVYQSATVKNDLIVVFCIAAWYYAYNVYLIRKDRLYIWIMALALAMSCGSKSSGIPIAFFAFLYTCWNIRNKRQTIYHFISAMCVCSILFGSIEIYINNFFVYHKILGDYGLIHAHSNNDGIKGGIANFIRYMSSGFSFGFYLSNSYTLLTYFFERICLAILKFLHLTNMGCFPRFPDSTLHFIKDGGEGSSDYGPIGGVAIWFAFYYSITRFISRNLIWKLSIVSMLLIFILAMTSSYGPWNNRFHMLAYILAVIAMVLASENLGKIEKDYVLPIIISSYIILNPFFSQNKNPKSFMPAILNREEFKLLENPGYIEIYRDITKRVNEEHINNLVVFAGSDAWMLPFFSIKEIKLVPEPDSDRLISTINATKSKYVLAINRDLPLKIRMHLIQVRNYNEQGDMGVSSLYMLK